MADPKRIPHDGSACPVSPGTRVRVWFRHPGYAPEDKLASEVEWKDKRHPWFRVESYAILEPDWAVEGPKLVEALEQIQQRANESGIGTIGLTDTIYAVHHIARTALSRIKGEEG